MKKSGFYWLAAVAITTLLSLSSAYAQTRVTAKIPFDYYAGAKHMPAGRYDINIASGTGLMTIRGDNNQIVSLTSFSAQRDARAALDPKLVFQCTDGVCSLSQVWADTSFGSELQLRPHVEAYQSARSMTVRTILAVLK